MEKLVKFPALEPPPAVDGLGLLRAVLPDRLSIDPSSMDARAGIEPMTVVFARLQFRRRVELEIRPFLHICCCNVELRQG